MMRILLTACRAPVLALLFACWLMLLLAAMLAKAIEVPLDAAAAALARLDDTLRAMARKGI